MVAMDVTVNGIRFQISEFRSPTWGIDTKLEGIAYLVNGASVPVDVYYKLYEAQKMEEDLHGRAV